jgi:hypothetical protein
MNLVLVAQDKLDAALAKEFAGVDADRKKILLQSVQNAIRRSVGAELHENFSKNLLGGDLEFYNAIIVVTPDDDAGPAAAAVPAAPAPSSPEAAATAVSESARAAESESARSRSR